jgi:hypothetical protein
MARRNSGPAPTDPIEKLFWGWAGIDNGHPCDDDRFYECVVQAAANRPGWDRAYVKEMLIRFGLREERAEQRSRDYWIGRCALKKRENLEMGIGAIDEVVF